MGSNCKIYKNIISRRVCFTIYFPDKIQKNPDGSTIQGFAPKTFNCKAIKKLSDKNIVFIDTDNIRHEVKVTQPVGYDLKKIY